jgi:hypothetical protein
MRFLSVAGCVCFLFVVAAWSQNLLENPGFEEGSGTAIPGWTSQSFGPSYKQFEIRTDAPLTGSASVGHLNLDAGGPPDEAILYQQASVAPGSFLEASISVVRHTGGLEPMDWHHIGVGLDTNGGIDYFAPWLAKNEVNPPDTSQAFSVATSAMATGTTVTFFVYSKMDEANGGWWAHYFDGASLTVSTAPTFTPIPTNTPTPPEDGPIAPWTVAGTIPSRTYFIPGFVHGDHMFWLEDDSTSIIRAELLADGSLAPWRRMNSATYETKWGHPIISVGDEFVYSIAAWGRVRRARIGPDGEILDVVPGQTGNKWDYHSMLFEEYIFGDRALLWNGAVSAPGPDGRHFVYCLGGFRYTCGPGCGPSNLDEVYTTRTLGTPDGLLEDWLQGPSLPDNVMSTTGLYHDGAIYAIGGGHGTDPQGGSTTDRIFRARIRWDGTLDAWTTLSRRLPFAARGIAAFAESGYLYIFGGLSEGVVFHTECFRAPFTPGGDLGAWQPLPSLPGGSGLRPYGRRGRDLYVTGVSSGGETAIYRTRFRDWAVGTPTPTSEPTIAPTPDPDQMLENPSFESNDGTHTNPHSWRPFRAGGETLHGCVPEADFDFAPAPKDGTWMFGSTTNWGKPHAGIYQQVVTTPGDELDLVGYAQVLKTDTGGRIRMGIDPTGNTLFTQYTVLWTDWLGDATLWTPIGFTDNNTILAASDRTTVFLELDSSLGRPWNGMYLDDLLMRRLSTGNPLPTPIFTPTPGGGTPTPVPPWSNLLVNPGFENYELGWSHNGPAVIDTAYLGTGPHWGYLSYYRVTNYGSAQDERSTVFQTVNVEAGKVYEFSAWYNVGAWTDQDLTPGSFDRTNCFLILAADPSAQMGPDPHWAAWPVMSERFHCEVNPDQNGSVLWSHATMRVTATGPQMQVGAILGSTWTLAWNRLIVDDVALVELGQEATATPTPTRLSPSMFHLY